MIASDAGAVAASMQVPPVVRSQKPAGVIPVVIAVAAACAAVVVLYTFNPSESGFYPLCIFHSTTGLLCPGCGSLRAMHQLSHGHLLTAFRCNVLLVSGLPFFAAFCARYAYLKLHERPVALNLAPPWIYAGTVILIVFGVIRNLAPFWFLRP